MTHLQKAQALGVAAAERDFEKAAATSPTMMARGLGMLGGGGAAIGAATSDEGHRGAGALGGAAGGIAGGFGGAAAGVLPMLLSKRWRAALKRPGSLVDSLGRGLVGAGAVTGAYHGAEAAQ